MFRSAHRPSRLLRGFFEPSLPFRESTNSSTSFCFSGGSSRSFSRTSSSIVIAASQPSLAYYTPATRDFDPAWLRVSPSRMGLLRTNGRTRSRRFVEFLGGQFPGAHELRREESRIIVP